MNGNNYLVKMDAGGGALTPSPISDPPDMLVLKAIAYSPGSPVLGTVDKLSESTSEPPSLSVSPLVGPR